MSTPPISQIALRRLLLVGGVILLLLGLWGGLARIGWDVPAKNQTLIFTHAGLLISGFVGTLITLERVVALGDRWALLAPASTLLGATLLLFGAPEDAAVAFVAAGAAGLTITFLLLMHRRGQSLELGIMTGGAVCWTIGSLLWLTGESTPALIPPWWMAFLVLTIAGERLELIRFQSRRFSRVSLLAALSLLLMGAILTQGDFDAGSRLTGVGLAAVAAWLITFDRARHALPKGGLPRYSATAMIGASLWLGVAGILWAIEGAVYFGLRYDAVIHAFFLGFTMSAILAHGPIILPSVASLRLRFSPALYAPLALLHASLILRLAADLAPWHDTREWAGLLNAVALVGFFVVMAGLIIVGRLRATPSPAIALPPSLSPTT